MTGADDIEGVDAGLGDEAVEVSVDEGETGTGSPVAEEAGLNILRDDVTLDEGIIAEEDHGYIYAHTIREVEKAGAVGRLTGSDIVCSSTELLYSGQLLAGESILRVEGDIEVKNRLWKERAIWRGVGLEKALARHGYGDGSNGRDAEEWTEPGYDIFMWRGVGLGVGTWQEEALWRHRELNHERKTQTPELFLPNTRHVTLSQSHTFTNQMPSFSPVSSRWTLLIHRAVPFPTFPLSPLRPVCCPAVSMSRIVLHLLSIPVLNKSLISKDRLRLDSGLCWVSIKCLVPEMVELWNTDPKWWMYALLASRETSYQMSYRYRLTVATNSPRGTMHMGLSWS